MIKTEKLGLSSGMTGVLLAVTGIFMFSSKAVMVKMAYWYHVDTVTLLLLRMVFSLPVYVFIAIRISIKEPEKSVKRKDLLAIFFLGFVGYYASSFFDFYGLQFINASLERLILFAYPTMVLVISAVVFRKPITKKHVLAILITYAGILVAFAKNLSLEGDNVWLGMSLIFLCAFTYAIYLVGSGQLIPRIGTVRFTAYAMIISCVIVIIHYLILQPGNLFGYPAEVYLLGLLMAVFATIIPSFLVSEAIRRIGASDFAVLGSIGPISTIVLAVIFLGEVINVYQMIGTAMVIVGVSLISRKKS